MVVFGVWRKHITDDRAHRFNPLRKISRIECPRGLAADSGHMISGKQDMLACVRHFSLALVDPSIATSSSRVQTMCGQSTPAMRCGNGINSKVNAVLSRESFWSDDCTYEWPYSSLTSWNRSVLSLSGALCYTLKLHDKTLWVQSTGRSFTGIDSKDLFVTAS